MSFISAHKERWGVEPICKALQVAPSTYYAAVSRQPSTRQQRDEELKAEIARVHRDNFGVYGIEKVWRQLNREDIQVGRDRVHRLMDEMDLEGVVRGKRKPITTPTNELDTRPADLVERDFTAKAPNALWVADLTYVSTWSGFCYVAFVIDVFSRFIVGWRVSSSLHADLALDALEMAIWRRRRHDLTGLVHHSDRGVQTGFRGRCNAIRSLRCNKASGDGQIGHCAPECTHRVVHRWHVERIGNRFWAAIAKGLTTEDAGAAAGISPAVAARWFRQSGGMPSVSRGPLSGRYLSFVEREEVALWRARGHGVRAIARQLHRSPSTISRELRRNAATRGGSLDYRASTAQWHADRRARRPKPAKLAVNDSLRQYVQDRLAGAVTKVDGTSLAGPHVRWIGRRHGRRQDRRWAASWSPEQIAHRLQLDFPDDPSMRISHEAIYQALFVQGRGALRRELSACLRTGRALRVPRARTRGRGKHFVSDAVMIRERPAEANDRAVPGHWEGDLIIGLDSSAIGTLVERTTRFTLLLHLPRMEDHGAPRAKNGPPLAGHGAEAVRDAIASTITTLPEQLRRSLTWDQGAELAQHAQLRIDTGLQVYFCDPHSPWQRGTNENTNGLLRQYFPKGTDLSRHSADDLAAVSATLNSRPRKTLGWRTPAETFDDFLKSTQINLRTVATIP